jgi:hypothetical protein
LATIPLLIIKDLRAEREPLRKGVCDNRAEREEDRKGRIAVVSVDYGQMAVSVAFLGATIVWAKESDLR